jgi:3-oxoacyl-[acyl-carrier-protein] synthase II
MPARLNAVVLVAQGMTSAYGSGVACCAEGLLAGKRALRPAGNRWPAALAALPVGAIPSAESPAPASPLLELVQAMLADAGPIPTDAALYLATTVGEISGLETEILTGAAPGEASRISRFPQPVAAALGLSGGPVLTVSSACTSSSAALALAASAIRRGEQSCALVVGCDLVSEFVLSGFAALMALDPDGAKPFDAGRRGVTLGSAATFALLMSRERAEREQRTCLGVIGGWGLTCDANHLTGPSRDGVPLADAVRQALQMAACDADRVAAICAHGTGTVYNDQTEMLAFRQVFGEQARPTFSVKGGMGHTLGAAGLAGVLLSLEFLRRGRLPPTVGLRQPSPDAQGWATLAPCPVSPAAAVLATGSGFGGVNAALVLALTPFPQAESEGTREWEPRVAGRGSCDSPAAAGLAADEGCPLPRNFGRFSAESRLAFHAIAQALAEAGMPGRVRNGAARIGVVAHDRLGSEAANRAYFSDYVASGRVLGRGQLFTCTLPTSVAAECAIALHLTGPLLYVAEPAGGEACARQAARGLLADDLADAVVLLSVTDGAAQASLLTPGGGAAPGSRAGGRSADLQRLQA